MPKPTTSSRARRYVALLRGINVGGKNLVPMADLREAFEAAGYDTVRTYIQSGNVLFETAAPNASLEPAIERMLERRYKMPLVVVVRSHAQLRQVVGKAPAGFGKKPRTFHSDVMFLKAPLTSRQVVRIATPREGVDEVWPGTGVVYWARLSERRVQSRVNRVAATPEYKLMTIRNWATTTKLLDLLDER